MLHAMTSLPFYMELCSNLLDLLEQSSENKEFIVIKL